MLTFSVESCTQKGLLFRELHAVDVICDLAIVFFSSTKR